MSDIGIMLLTHERPDQLRRLVRRLVRSFDAPPIVCHHDFDKHPFSTRDLEPHVTFVRPHVRTGWGEFGLVEAIIRTMRVLRDHADSPEWFVLLSGSDWPIKTGRRIIGDLKNGAYDVYMHLERIDPRRLPSPWHRACYRRYFGAAVRVPYLNRRRRLSWHTVTFRSRFLPALDAPFSDRFACFAGEMWFSINRSAVDIVLRYHDEDGALARKYAARRVPDESYVHTILGNQPGLRLAPDCRRYTDWSGGGSHPKILTLEDLPLLLRSEAHFARKFDATVDARVLDELDAILDGGR